jgi:hypothetical protein
MLPGFRFLFVAIVLSMSVLVFGLGAATLFRAAHQEFASTPSWRAAPETMFAQQPEEAPTLAMLRVDASPATGPKAAMDVAPVVTAVQQPTLNTTPIVAAAEPKGPDLSAVPPPKQPAADTAPTPVVRAPPTATMAAPTEAAPAPKPPETTSAMTPETTPTTPTSVATTSAPKPENAPSPQTANAAAQAALASAEHAAPATPDTVKVATTEPTALPEAKLASTEQAPAPVDATAPTRPEPAVAISEPESPPAAPIAESVPTMTAMLVKPPMPRPRPARASHPTPDKSAEKEREARLAAHRRRMAARARLARQAAQFPNPFGVPATPH